MWRVSPCKRLLNARSTLPALYSRFAVIAKCPDGTDSRSPSRHHLSSRRNCPLPSHSLLSLPRSSAPSILATNRRVTKERIDSFYRLAKIIDHVEWIHFKGKDPEAKIEYYHPIYKSQGLVLEHVQHFKSHIQTVHGITLREPRFVRSIQ